MKFKYQPDPFGHRLTNRSDVELRYNESVVLYKGDPHYLVTPRLDDWLKVELIPFVDGAGYVTSKKIRVDIRDQEISTDFVFGWFNFNIDGNGLPIACYMERLPTRRYKQGATASNTMLSHPTYSNGELMFRSISSSIDSISSCLSNSRASSKVITAKMNSKELIDFAIDKIMNLNSVSRNHEVFYLETLNTSIALSKRVALVYKPTPQPKKLKSRSEVMFTILIDKQEIGTFNPNIMDIKLDRDGLYSIIQDDLIKAGLLV